MNLYRLFNKKLLCSSFIVPLFSAVSFCAHAQDPEPMGAGAGGNCGGRLTSEFNLGKGGANGRGGNGGTNLSGGRGGTGGDPGRELFQGDTIIGTVTGENGEAGEPGCQDAANGGGGGGGGTGLIMREVEGDYRVRIMGHSTVRGGNGGDGGAAFSEGGGLTQGEESEDGGGSGGDGGNGVFIRSRNQLMNQGLIGGGDGGNSGASNSTGGRAGVGGRGGVGVILENGAGLLNVENIWGGEAVTITQGRKRAASGVLAFYLQETIPLPI